MTYSSGLTAMLGAWESYVWKPNPQSKKSADNSSGLKKSKFSFPHCSATTALVMLPFGVPPSFSPVPLDGGQVIPNPKCPECNTVADGIVDRAYGGFYICPNLNCEYEWKQEKEGLNVLAGRRVG
jgi:hypothetical protein